MKRLTIFLFSLCVLLAFSATSAFAADTQGSNVTITVVMPDPASAPEPTPEPLPDIKVYPSDVTENRDGGVWQIVKTYELAANENPADIPRADFERGGWKFTLTDIIRKETANAETRPHTETVTVNTDTKELEKILPLFAPTMEFTADDDFVGILTLDVASIKVETAGTKTTSYEMKVTREYPRLSANDTSLLPKTVTENGKTYTLANVDWKAGNYETVDYEQIPEYYTAVATYTATGTSTKPTGYITTAQYSGTLAKLTQGKTVYTAYFIGEEIRTPLEMTDLPKPTEAPTAVPTETPVDGAVITAVPEPTDTAEPTEQPAADADDALSKDGEDTKNNNALFVIIPILAVLAGAAFYFLKIRRRKPDETITDITVDAGSDAGDGDSGNGGRL